ncbi:MAG: hypothetical protein U9R29_04595 [Thermodesulfobacteriota bacterium]|nr:hypothetical protein [Thermodesulfobacteriota bacterium]
MFRFIDWVLQLPKELELDDAIDRVFSASNSEDVLRGLRWQ